MKVASNRELSAVLAAVGVKDQWLSSSPHFPRSRGHRCGLLSCLPACCHTHGAISSGATACNCGQPPNTNDRRWPCGATGLSSPPFSRGIDGTEGSVPVLPRGSLGWLSLGRALLAWDSRFWPRKGLWAEPLLTSISGTSTVWVRPKCWVIS